MPRSAADASRERNSSVAVMSSGSVVSAKRFRYIVALVRFAPRSASAPAMATGGGCSGRQVERGLRLRHRNGADRRTVEAGLVEVYLARLQVLVGTHVVTLRLQI